MSWIYRTSGAPAGYIFGRWIRDLGGNAIAQLQGDRVYTMAGAYVGELYDAQVVNRNTGNYGSIGSSGNPGCSGNRGNPGNRGNHGCPFPDVFDKLVAG